MRSTSCTCVMRRTCIIVPYTPSPCAPFATNRDHSADVLCLQDVDFFHQWWRPQLTSAGYDSLFKQRTSIGGVHREGVVIAWKRDVFDLFQSGDVELNRWAKETTAGRQIVVFIPPVMQVWPFGFSPAVSVTIILL